MMQNTRTFEQLEQELALAKARIAELEDRLESEGLAAPQDDCPSAADRAGATQELLRLFATATTRCAYLDSVRDILARWTGTPYVGIRLLDSRRRIPYATFRGFDRAFWEQENWLCVDCDQCICTRVVTAEPDPQDMPFVTAGGSFVCNDTDRLIASLTPEQTTRFRGHCIKVGFKSVTVLPLRYRQQVIGAIHLADRPCQRFPYRTIEFIEAMSPLIGEAIHRFDIEDALRQSNELLEKTFESIDLYLAYMDRDFHFIRVNRGYARIDGHEPGYYVGKNHFDLFPNADNERIFRQAVETGEPYFVLAKPFEYSQNPERGVTYWDWSLQPVKDAAGRVEGLVLCLVDVTERERARAALREREVLWRAVFDQSFQYMAVLATDGRVLERNDASAALLGLARSERGTLFWEGPAWSERGKARDRIRRAIEQAARGQVVQHEVQAITANGRQVTIDLSIKPVHDAGGAIAYLVAEGRDITRRKQLETQILEISSREQRRIGQDLHDVLGQNLTGLAFLNRILEQKLAERAIPEAEDAARLGEVIKQAIAQARALSRGLCPIDQKPEGLMTALQALAHNVTQFYGISCLFESSGPVLLNDMAAAMHLYHIAQEAVNNGIKHGNADQVRIRLEDDGDGFVLSIRDNGCGIPDQLGPAQGMGLNIMGYRAGMIGGSLEIKRHPEGGTLVTCTCRDGAARSEVH